MRSSRRAVSRLPVAAICAAAVLGWVRPGAGQIPGRMRVPFSDEAVGKAIERGAKFIWSTQQADGSWPAVNTVQNSSYTVGPTAICAYALLESGVPPTDPRMRKALMYLKATKSDMTYCIAFRALAWGAAMRYDQKFRQLLRKDVRTLILSMDREGSYTYFSKGRPPKDSEYPRMGDDKGTQTTSSQGDNSNTQYGLLGVWAGALQNEEVPAKYWQMSLKYWLKHQAHNGGWGYHPELRKQPYLSMTLAGLASVYVCIDNLYRTKFLTCREHPDLPAVKKALKYVVADLETVRRMGGWYYYAMYGIERVALATGYKYFGEKDWYRWGSSDLLARQGGDGSWTMGAGNLGGGPSTSTSYALLFLLRGRRPVVINRLEYEGDWNNRPRGPANLTRWFTREFEREVHWQIVSIKSPVAEWHDAPVLCISGAKAPTFSDDEMDKLRRFVHQGGTILSTAECSGKAFKDGIREVYKKLFPDYKLVTLPKDHSIYKEPLRLPGRPTLMEISNGARPMVVHTDDDLPRSWQAGTYKTHSVYYRAVANVVVHTNGATAVAGQLRNRGTSLWPKPYKGTVRAAVKIARLQHGANCDPEPLAYERFSRMLGRQQQIKVTVVGPIPVNELAASGAKLATLTGTGELTLTEPEQAALKEWVGSGGTLLVDAAGGDEAFAKSAEAMLQAMYGARALRLLALEADVYSMEGFEIKKVGYRRSLLKTLGSEGPPRVRAAMLEDRPAVYFSREDLTCGLLGNPCDLIRGYTPKSAYRIVRNIAILSAGGPPPSGGTPGGAIEPVEPLTLTAQASVANNEAAKAVDGDPATKWSTGRAMKEGDWFSVDLGRVTGLKQAVLDMRGSPKDVPAGFTLHVSRDGMQWHKGLEADKVSAQMGINFPESVRLRYLRFVLTGGGQRPWSIHEIHVKLE